MNTYELDYGTHTVTTQAKDREHAFAILSDEGQRPCAVRMIPNVMAVECGINLKNWD